MVQYHIKTQGELRPHLGQEWLLTNGTGAFSSSTVIGCNTRRYHGLLVAATKPPVGRMMMLNRIGEILSFEDDPQRMLEFSVNQFDEERFHPRGERYLRRFELDDIACFEYDVEGIAVIKEVQLLWGRSVAAVRYQITPPKGRKVTMQLLPFVSLRDFHQERRAANSRFAQQAGEHDVSVLDGAVKLHIGSDAAFREQSDWWYGHYYALEAERGLGAQEDLFCPGRFVRTITDSATVMVWASVEAIDGLDWDAERRLRAERVGRPLRDPPLDAQTLQQAPRSATVRRLLRASADFIVARKSPDGSVGTTIMAGYPWFADWGRDTMIALPGLLLCTERFEAARCVLSVFAQYVSEGMIPNVFDDYSNQPHYNTVDASLWFIHAAFEYLRFSNDRGTFASVLEPACRKIIEGYRKGTRYGIGMDPADGLIRQGDAHTQLTWMDAKSGDVAHTPRQGKPVEINALWYHALLLMGESELARKVRASFRQAFWISPYRGLADVVDKDRRDQSLRPNQIFAVSLPNSPLDADQQIAVVEVVRRELLTPMGLRSLEKGDPRYKGRYAGPQMQRDAAYHNGTVWAWLIGPFLEAYLRVNGRSAEAVAQAQRWLEPLVANMEQTTIGQIGEIFEGDPPHRPVGSPAQAWSVAEVLRMAIELGM